MNFVDFDSGNKLVNSFVYGKYAFYVDSGYKRIIGEGKLPKSKLVYVILYDPLDKRRKLRKDL